MIRKAPPLEAIEIFVAAARGRSFRAVAHQMALSPSAVSRRIATLEGFLGTLLFDRSGPVPVLTPAGQEYLIAIEPAIAAIRDATTEIGTTRNNVLRIATSHSFASWLMPRLPALTRTEQIEVELSLTRDPMVLMSGEVNLAIWGAMAVPRGTAVEPLFAVNAFPACAPALADGRLPPRTDGNLADYPLLAVRSPAGMWDRWLAASGQPGLAAAPRAFDTLQLMYEAASAGLGVTLAMPLVAEAFLIAGRIVPCGHEIHCLGETYCLYRSATARNPAIVDRRFAAWLRHEVQISLEIFDALALGRSTMLAAE